MMLTAVRRLCGQRATGPSWVLDSRTNASARPSRRRRPDSSQWPPPMRWSCGPRSRMPTAAASCNRANPIATPDLPESPRAQPTPAGPTVVVSPSRGPARRRRSARLTSDSRVARGLAAGSRAPLRRRRPRRPRSSRSAPLAGGATGAISACAAHTTAAITPQAASGWRKPIASRRGDGPSRMTSAIPAIAVAPNATPTAALATARRTAGARRSRRSAGRSWRAPVPSAGWSSTRPRGTPTAPR